MMVRQIKLLRRKCNLLLGLDEGVDVLVSILVLLLCNDILGDVNLLLKVLQNSLGWHITLRVRQEPALGLDLLLLGKLHKSILRSNIKRRIDLPLLTKQPEQINMGARN